MKIRSILVPALGLFALSACDTVAPYLSDSATSVSASGRASGPVGGCNTRQTQTSQSIRNSGAGSNQTTGSGDCAPKAAPAAPQPVTPQRVAVAPVQPAPIPRPVVSKPVVTISGDIAFDVNSSAIKPAFKAELNSIAQRLQGSGVERFTIVGHTDSDGGEEYNLKLSERRAKSVADYLATQGIPRHKMITSGSGEELPISDNDSDSGKAANRRVEIFARS